MAKDPGARYATAAALAAALGDALEATRAVVDAKPYVRRRSAARGSPPLQPSSSSRQSASSARRAGHDEAPTATRTSGARPGGRERRADPPRLVRVERVDRRRARCRLQVPDRPRRREPQDAASGCDPTRGARESLEHRPLPPAGTLPRATPAARSRRDHSPRDGAAGLDRRRRRLPERVPLREGCPPTSAYFTRAAVADARATTAKRRFVAAFNRLALRFGMRPWEATEL